jgi:hypothetical protein
MAIHSRSVGAFEVLLFAGFLALWGPETEKIKKGPYKGGKSLRNGLLKQGFSP